MPELGATGRDGAMRFASGGDQMRGLDAKTAAGKGLRSCVHVSR
jgi:hypothetical protein